MKVLITGSSGHLGEALCREFARRGDEVVGIDILASATTTHIGSITDREFVAAAMVGVHRVFHTATLHKPHIKSHSNQQFVDVNVTGTLVLLEAAVVAHCETFVFTSSTSVFGDALKPAENMPAVWITESVKHIPKNIYGVTKAAAEDMCQLFQKLHKLPCIVLRTSRFFAEEDDDDFISAAYSYPNMKVNEYLYRRIDLGDVVSAHCLAADKATAVGFKKYIISATAPFTPNDALALRMNAPDVIAHYFPDYFDEFSRRNWRMFESLDRVYDNSLARAELGWEPKINFRTALDVLKEADASEEVFLFSAVAKAIGSKGYGN